MSFVNLHVHSAQGSLLDSILTVEQIVKYAVDNKQPAIALSDHGTMHAFVDHVELCNKHGIKPITACEIYEVDDYLEKNDTKERKQLRYHLLLIVKTQQGLKNLFKIVSEAATTGFYGKPRVSVSWIKENNLGEGIICLTACQAGRISRYLEGGQNNEAKKFLKLLKETFDYVACELQSHPTESQLCCNTRIWEFAQETHTPYVITTDAHMLGANQIDTHSIFVEIGEGREAGEIYAGCHLQNEKDVLQYLGDWNTEGVIQQGIEETIRIVAMVDDNIDYGLGGNSIMPIVDVPSKYSSHEDYLRHLVFQTFEEKFGWMSKEEQIMRRERLEKELPVINALDYTDYFIMLYMIAKESDKKGLPRGYSRGCFTKDAIVWCKDALKTIDQVVAGDEVLSADGQFHNVINTFKYNINEDMIEFEYDLQGSSYKKYKNICTTDHKILVRRGENISYIPASGLKMGDLLCSPIIQHQQYNSNALQFDLLKYNDKGFEYDDEYIYEVVNINKPYQFSPVELSKQSGFSEATFQRIGRGEMDANTSNRKSQSVIHWLLNNTPFNSLTAYQEYYKQHSRIYRKIKRHVSFDENWNYFIGMMYGDGWVRAGDDGQKRTNFGIATNNTNFKDIVNKNVFYLICHQLGIEDKDILVNVSATKSLTQYAGNSYIATKFFADILFRSKKSKIKTFNPKLLNQPTKMLDSMYQGFLNTDGSIQGSKLCFDNTSLSLIAAFKYLNNILGYEPLALDVREAWTDRRGYCCKESYKLRRPKNRIHNLINADRFFYYLPISNIKKIKNMSTSVYDLMIDGNSSYTINNIVVHNSGANCLCLFMLNVTQIDSVRWDLDFARFANLGRKGSLADFDWDISKRRRKEIIELTENLFGKENVIPIATFNTLSTKVAIKDIGKVLNEKNTSPYFGQIPYSLRESVAKMIPTVKTLNDLGEEEEKEVLLKELLEKNNQLGEIHNKYPLWFKYVMELEGLPKSRGRHASATLITPHPVIEHMPLCLDNDKNVMAQLEMHAAMDKLNYCKMDYLGLETLDVIDDTLQAANLTWQDVDINHLNLAEQKVYDDVYKNGNTIGCFQMESAEARKMLIDAKADNIEDIIVVNAANRPGTKDSFPDYCNNKSNPDNAVVIHKDLKSIFSKTNFVLLYQEDLLHLLAYAGFDEVEQDAGRRAAAKKVPEKMKALESHFRDGLSKHNWTNKQQNDMWELVLKQSLYSFNRGHACAYGLLSYLTAYLKTFYPTQFMAAVLTSKSDRVEKLSVVINDCHRMGIKVSTPDINQSNVHFTAIPEKNEILFGLLAVKGLGQSVIDQILANRPYSSFDDYLSKVQDKTSTIALIKAGAFPTNNRMKLMQKYAKSLYEEKAYKPVSSLPTKAKLAVDWDINVDDYKEGKKVNKEKVLEIYNQKRKIQFDEEQKQKYQQYMTDFRDKYATDEFLWEFQSLSMFITHNPLQEAYDLIGTEWDDVASGDKAVVPCVITDIKRKKDRNNNPFAYIDLCINNQIVEATIWSRQLKQYSDLIKKGSCIAILGRKEDNHLFVERIKPYDEWLNKIKTRYHRPYSRY